MVSDEVFSKTLAQKWNGPCNWSPAICCGGGVAFLCSPRQLEHISVGIVTQYIGALMEVLVNDFLSNPILLDRGVWQGDALSPTLYILCVEVLTCKIRASPYVKGFLLPGASGLEFRVCQYADDTTGFIKDEKSLHVLFGIIEDFL